MHDSGETVGGGLRPYTTPWDILFQQIPVLTEQSHGYCVDMIVFNNLVVLFCHLLEQTNSGTVRVIYVFPFSRLNDLKATLEFNTEFKPMLYRQKINRKSH